MMTGSRWRLAAAVCLLPACGDADSGRSPADGAPPSAVESAPALLLGRTDADPDQVFHRVASVFRNEDGLIYVADGGSHQVRVFDASGTLVTRFGGPGGGAREFATLNGVWPLGRDSVYTYDAMALRLTVWSAAGEYGRTVPVTIGTTPMAVRWLEDGRRVAAVRIPAAGRRAVGTLAMDSLALYLLRDGEPTLLETIPLRHQYTHQVPGRGGSITNIVPFRPEGVFAVGRDHLYAGWPESWTFRRIRTADGSAETIVIDRPLRPLDRGVIDAFLDDRAQRFPAEQQPAVRQTFGAFPFGEQLPAYDRMLEDDAGAIWLREYLLPEAPNRWIVRAPDGATREVLLPHGFVPHQIGRQFIAGVLLDEDGREQVALLRRTDG
jgi:hypothetical protein